ncbi:MAG TPA: ABC transporter permease subunit [Candidatus Eremiobacteraeota bacterium]|nr:MAG: Inner membrane transport permease YbhR [bacterium ADurb.Bin363]HPZ09789.1 ABC transporter permease subunit [Candidatus Eremiobacteraeota bacterium]
MKSVWTIIRKELKAYFASPIAYVVIAVFLFIIGFYFFALLQRFSDMSWAIKAQMQYQFGMQNLNINEEIVRPFFSIILTISLFIMPIITMRLFSEEMETGTMELLLTSPITEVQLIMGKFLASLIFYLTILVMTVPHILILFSLSKNVDIAPVLAGYGGLILVGCTFLGMGLFISSLTRNQIIAAVLSFGVLLLLGIISWASNFSGPTLGKVLSYISIFTHFEDFPKGVLDTKHIIYYLSFSFGGLFLTYTSLDSLKWRG